MPPADDGPFHRRQLVGRLRRLGRPALIGPLNANQSDADRPRFWCCGHGAGILAIVVADGNVDETGNKQHAGGVNYRKGLRTRHLAILVGHEAVRTIAARDALRNPRRISAILLFGLKASLRRSPVDRARAMGARRSTAARRLPPASRTLPSRLARRWCTTRSRGCRGQRAPSSGPLRRGCPSVHDVRRDPGIGDRLAAHRVDDLSRGPGDPHGRRRSVDFADGEPPGAIR